MTYDKRLYQGPDDLRLMQALVHDTWDLGDKTHIGNLAWDRYAYIDKENEWPTLLLERSSVLMGWGWLQLPGYLILKTRDRTTEPVHEILDWFEATATDKYLNISFSEAEVHVCEALVQRGYEENFRAPFDLMTQIDLDRLPNLDLPAGFRVRNMSEDISFEARAKAHRDAWSYLPFYSGKDEQAVSATSKVSEDFCRRVFDAWPYRPDLDWIVEAPNGTLAACCIIWLDEENKVAILEPVGTHQDYRNLGLGRAVCLAALQAARDLGAKTGRVCPRGDDAYPVPRKLYASIGFTTFGRSRTYYKKR